MRLRPSLLAFAAAAVLAAGCGRAAPAPAASSAPAATSASGDAALRTVITAYAVELLRRYPTVNTYLGGGGLDASLRTVDGTLRDYSPAAIAGEDQWLANVQRDINAVAGPLSDNARIDRDVALAQIAFLLRQH